MNYPWYSEVAKSKTLQQGDFVESMSVPEVVYSKRIADENGKPKINWITTDWIILTQSCDLNPLNQKAGQYVMVCPISKIDKTLGKRKREDFYKNKHHAFHSLRPATHKISDNHYLLVDFREARYAKLSAVKAHAQAVGNGPRLRLNSPYLEALSDRFGNYFSRVAYPVDLHTPDDEIEFYS